MDTLRLEGLSLRVPGDWLDACGFGKEARVLPVLSIVKKSMGFNEMTFVTVLRDGKQWVVHKEVRKAEYVHTVLP